jgi:hypothetical protein
MSSVATPREVELADLRPRLMRLFSAHRMGHVAKDLPSETILRVLTAMRAAMPTDGHVQCTGRQRGRAVPY